MLDKRSAAPCCFLLLLVQASEALFKLQEQFSWNILDFAYPTIDDRNEALLKQNFIPENNLPVGIEIWRDKLFVTVPRWRSGVPSTLNYIPLNSTDLNPALIPYPDWESNRIGDCSQGLTTAYRIKADACNRLWVLDTGTFGIGSSTRNSCPYALNVFDLTTNKRLRRYVLQQSDINPDTFIANIAVELVKNDCNDAFAYMSDELGYGLIVYSWRADSSWRFSHPFFRPDPLAGDFTIDGLNFQWDAEGIFGMSLSPVVSNSTGERFLFFSPLASNRAFAVSTGVLRNSSRVQDSYRYFVALPERGPNSHTTAHVMSESGVELFNLIDRNAIGCWNSQLPHNSGYMGVVDQDHEKLIFPADVKIDEFNGVWVLSDKMSTFLLGQLNYTTVNFGVFFAPLEVLIAGTVCEKNLINTNFSQ